MDHKPYINTCVPDLDKRADKDVYNDLLHCNRCGLCTSQCPTYLGTGNEGFSPRGRNQIFRALIEERLMDAHDAKPMLDTCLLCGICTSVCFAEVPTAKLMCSGREKIMESGGEPFVLKFVLRFLLPRPRIFELFLKTLYWGKRVGLGWVLYHTGLLSLVSPHLSAAQEIVRKVPGKFLRSILKPAPEDADVVQFLGCGPNYLKPEVSKAAACFLQKQDISFGYAPNLCCGLPAQSLGDLSAARELARRNIMLLEGFPKAMILFDDSSCAATVKSYPELFSEEPQWQQRAASVSARCRDLTEWLVPRLFLPVSPSPHLPIKVTYHDPCKARYAQKIVNQPREILKNLPGVDYVELPEADQCCGAGGTYCFLQPGISRSVLDRKIRNIMSTGADVVLTSSVSCLLQLQFGLKRAKSKIQAMHLAEFLKTCIAEGSRSFCDCSPSKAGYG